MQWYDYAGYAAFVAFGLWLAYGHWKASRIYGRVADSLGPRKEN
jgi:hypothetical protein